MSYNGNRFINQKNVIVHSCFQFIDMEIDLFNSITTVLVAFYINHNMRNHPTYTIAIGYECNTIFIKLCLFYVIYSLHLLIKKRYRHFGRTRSRLN